MTKGKRTNNDLPKHTHKTRDRVTRTPLKNGGKLYIVKYKKEMTIPFKYFLPNARRTTFYVTLNNPKDSINFN